jgi:N-acylglucosamine 2-epimerase/mannose-6-phosphate isomerase
LELAHQTLDLIERVLKAPHGGYWNDSDKTLPREQNPHMHLAEAANAWFEASADTRFSDLASELVDLMQRRFSDPVSGQLGEFFGLDWSPIGGDSGSIVEPGHQFEWSWIISHFGRLTGRPSLEIAERLIKSGQAGFDPATGLTVDQVDRKGRILQASRRLWPQTEALKAALVEAEFFGKANNERIAKITNALFANYLDTAPVGGTWIDHYNQDGSIKADKIPSTSLYHIQLAFLELLRLEPKLSNS